MVSKPRRLAMAILAIVALAFLLFFSVMHQLEQNARPFFLTEGPCRANSPFFYRTITTPHGLPYCVQHADNKVLRYHWSNNAEWLAIAVIDVDAPTRGRLSGRHGYLRPPAYNWHLLHLPTSTFKWLEEADNLSVGDISPDGLYYMVWGICDYGECKGEIRLMETGNKICDVTMRGVWLDGDCINTLLLSDGTVWDLELEYDRNACGYYYDMNEEYCRNLVTLTPSPIPTAVIIYPTVTPFPTRYYPAPPNDSTETETTSPTAPPSPAYPYP